MTTKKVAVKKVGGAKKPAQKNLKKAKRVLVQAQGEQCFWTHNGAIISTLIDLSNLLASIHADAYKYHVRKDKNDFADWVEFVLGDKELAGLLRKAKTPKSARTSVVRRLKIYDI